MPRKPSRETLASNQRMRDGLHNLGNLVAALSCQAFALRAIAGNDESLVTAIDEINALIIEVQKSLKQMQQEVPDAPLATSPN